MRISTAQMFMQRITAMLDQQARLGRTELQIATGKRMLSAADDPAGALKQLQLTDRLEQTGQYVKNTEAASSRLSLEEGALSAAVNLLQRIRDLAVQSNNDAMSPADRKAIAAEVRGHLDGMLEIANTRDASGEYLFAGYQGHTRPFSHDGNGNFAYHGDQGQRHLQVGPSRQIASGDHGARVFLGVPASGGMNSTFGILRDFAEALETGAPLPDTITDVDSAMGQILNTQADVGARMRALEDQREINESVKLLLEQDRSAVSDLDYAEAITRFNQQLLALQASQQAFVKVQGMTLFNFLT